MAQVKTITCTSLNYARDVFYLKKILAVKRKYLTTYDGNKFDVCIYLPRVSDETFKNGADNTEM